MTRPVRAVLFSTLVLSAAAVPARAQLRAGPQFRVNTYTTSVQMNAAVDTEPEGGFVVVWQSYGPDGDYWGVFGQIYREDGSPAGAEFQVNEFTTYGQYRPRVAAGETGFVVTWASYIGGGIGHDVFARQFDPDGVTGPGEIPVASGAVGEQKPTSIAMNEDGSFVVVWTDYDQNYGVVRARLYQAQGGPRGSAFQVNVYTTDTQTGGRVVMARDGHFVVAWNSYGQDGAAHGVFMRAFTFDGTPITGELQVNQGSFMNDEYLTGMAMAPDGRFVIVWQQPDGDGEGVVAQRFDAMGSRVGGEFFVNSYRTSFQGSGSVSMSERGDFVVAWQSLYQDGDYLGVFGQRFDAGGNPRGPEFLINATTTDSQADPRAAMDRVGNFVVVWTDRVADGSADGVFAQRFGGLQMTEIDVDPRANLGPLRALASDGNDVLEPGETVIVETSWTNSGTATLSGLTADIPNFTGPAGGTYTVIDGTASFPPIAPGERRSCAEAVPPDCYEVGVSAATRPALHWDAVFEEEEGSVILGQAKLWDMHIGDSFADVPRTNLFYRFIETLLHHSVTGGCDATRYCPAQATTREQMAVFVLVAKEGVSFAPLACVSGAETFADVRFDSPFCRWVEELARRGIVAGCGGGNYCPTAAVQRDQMAVFVLRTLDGDLVPPACTAGSEVFADVPASSPFCRWVEELARRGVVAGCGGGNYCPAGPVTREQMGVFISVTFELALYGP